MIAKGRGANVAAERIDVLRQRIEGELRDLVTPAYPPELGEVTRYVLDGGGKRLRPIVVMLAAGVFGADEGEAVAGALSVEIFHNFTLVHDDIMDRAPTRRSRPTVHEKWNVPTAILVGDFMFGLAYDQLAKLRSDRLHPALTIFNDMVGGLCAGQMLDMAFEDRDRVGVEEYLDMIDQKTGALLKCCLQLGGVLGNASASQICALGDVAINMGRAFQIKDDLLDVAARDPQWGKQVGGDLLEGKKTYLLLRGLEMTEGEDWQTLSQVLDDKGVAPSEVERIRDIFQRAGVLDAARSAVHHYTNRAIEAVSSLPATNDTRALAHLVESLNNRMY